MDLERIIAGVQRTARRCPLTACQRTYAAIAPDPKLSRHFTSRAPGAIDRRLIVKSGGSAVVDIVATTGV